MSESHGELSAPYVLEYAYKRSVGPVLGRFLTELRDGRIVGIRGRDGSVLVPPQAYDPATGESLEMDFVEVGPAGTITTWCWVHEPHAQHPLQRPFAYALVQLDGATTGLLHVVDAGSEEQMKTGMRVVAEFAEQRTGRIQDIACFRPAADVQAQGNTPKAPQAEQKPVTKMVTPISLNYQVTPGRDHAAFLRALMDKRIIGHRCPVTDKVYVPPRGASPTHGVRTTEVVEVSQTGTVTTFCIVNIPFEGQELEPPYVFAAILLDGSDTPLFHLIGGVEASLVHTGQRVQAVWRDRADFGPTLENIRWFAPTGEPDAPFESYQEHI